MLSCQPTTRTITDEMGRTRVFRYEVTVGEIPAGRFNCEHYGVTVSEVGGETARAEGITASPAQIQALFSLLTEHLVGPTTLRDVVEDFLCAAKR